MSLHSSSQPWTFTKLYNVLHLRLQRWTFFSVFFALHHLLDSRILLHHYPWWNSENLCLFLRVDIIRMPWSITKWLFVPYGLRGSVEKRVSVMRTNVLQHTLQEALSGCPDRSCVVPSVLHSWEDPSMVIIPILNNLLKEELSGFPWSIFCNNRIPRILFSVVSLPRAHWSGKTTRTMSILATRFIIGFDFAVTSFFSCILLRSASPLQQETVGLKRLMLNKHNKWFHSSREKFPSVKMSASLFFGCRCIWFGFWNPD